MQFGQLYRALMKEFKEGEIEPNEGEQGLQKREIKVSPLFAVESNIFEYAMAVGT